MILRSNHIDENVLRGAAFNAGVGFNRIQMIARPRAHSVYIWNIHLKGSSKYAPRGYPGTKAATYEEWGKFLAQLFDYDSRLKCDGTYKDEDDFHAKTDGQFSATLH